MSGYQCVNQTGCSDHTRPHGCGLAGCKDRNKANTNLERLVKWAIGLGLSTGHASTEQDLLDEVGDQITILMVRVAELDKSYTAALKSLENMQKEALGL